MLENLNYNAAPDDQFLLAELEGTLSSLKRCDIACCRAFGDRVVFYKRFATTNPGTRIELAFPVPNRMIRVIVEPQRVANRLRWIVEFEVG